MGYPSKILPDRVLRRIPRAEREPLGKAGMTDAEAKAKFCAVAERTLQNDMVNLLRQRSLFFNRSRMDKRPTCRKGMPDFMIVLPGGRNLAVEAKIPGGVLSADQQTVFTEYWQQTGQVVHIVTSLIQFRELLERHHP